MERIAVCPKKDQGGAGTRALSTVIMYAISECPIFSNRKACWKVPEMLSSTEIIAKGDCKEKVAKPLKQ